LIKYQKISFGHTFGHTFGHILSGYFHSDSYCKDNKKGLFLIVFAPIIFNKNKQKTLNMLIFRVLLLIRLKNGEL
jgi:uncharacterized membrane protein